MSAYCLDTLLLFSSSLVFAARETFRGTQSPTPDVDEYVDNDHIGNRDAHHRAGAFSQKSSQLQEWHWSVYHIQLTFLRRNLLLVLGKMMKRK